MTNSHAPDPQQPKRRRRFRRSAAVLFGIGLIISAELLCVIFNWGAPSLDDDPFVRFESIRPLFTLDNESQRFHVSSERQRYFASDEFAANKPTNGFRVFCLGGSTVQGRPYSIETSFSTWLELSLKTASPERAWEVVNCGGISYASYRLVPILKECLQYQPDLVLICTGHNEFLEDRTYAPDPEQPAALRFAQQTLGKLRLYRLTAQLLKQVAPNDSDSNAAPKLETEVSAILDFEAGIDAYHRDAKWRAGVVEHYEQNLRRLVAMASDANVPAILIRPPSNLADCPPFKSQHRDGLSDEDIQRWRQLMNEARDLAQLDPINAIPVYEEAISIDPDYALTHYLLGKCYRSMGAGAAARDALLAARDLDICPLRMPAELDAALLRVASETGTPLIDAFELLEGESSGRILGDDILDDHVHPNFHGHQQIADALFREMERKGWVTPRVKWRDQQQAVYQDHFNALPESYHLRGRRQLEALNGWARGRVTGEPWLDPSADFDIP